MILSFQNRFEEPIIKGAKIHTFRLDPNDRWKVGMPIQFYVNARTKQMRKFREDGECMRIQSIIIKIFSDELCLIVKADHTKNGIVPVSDFIDKDKFIPNDGLKSECDFITCIKQLHPGKEILTGKIIHWTDFKY